LLVSAKVEINFLETYTNTERTKLLNEIIADFEKIHPEIKVNLISPPYEQAKQKAILMLSTKQPLDIVEVSADTIFMYANNKLILNLESYLESWEHSKTFVPTAWEVARTVDKTAYVVPESVYSSALFYRTDIFNKYEIDHPPQTITQMFEMAKNFTDPSKDQYGYAFRGKNGQQEAVCNLVLPFLDDVDINNIYLKTDGSLVFNDPRFKEGLILYTRFFHETAPKDAINWAFSEQINAFSSGITPLILQEPDFIKPMDEMIGREKYMTAPLPLGPYGKAYVNYYFPSLGIASYSEHKDEAWEFIKYFLSPEVNAYYSKNNGTLPIHRVTYEEDDFFSTGVYQAWKYMMDHPDQWILSKTPLNSPKWTEWREVTNVDCQSLELGNVSLDDTIAKWIKFWEE